MKPIISSIFAKFNKNKLNIKRVAIAVGLSTLLAIETFFVISPVLKSGYYSDDEVISLERYEAEIDNKNTFEYYSDRTKEMLFTVKRPDIFISYWITPYLLPNLFQYKLAVTVAIIINLTAFSALINLFLKSRYYGYLISSIVPIMLQFRLYHDPITSFYLTQQSLILLLIFSLIFLIKHLNKKSLINYILSVLFFLLAIFSYEVSYFYIFAISLIIALRIKPFRIWSLIKLLIPYIIVIILGLTSSYLIQDKNSSNYGGTYTGVQSNLSIQKVFQTFFIQASATLPTSYRTSAHSGFFCQSIECFSERFQLIDLFPLIAFAVIFYFSTKEIKRNNNLFSLGLLIALAPIPLISISQKYQTELISSGFGFGYITVYLQYFGLAILIGFIIIKVINLKNSLIKLPLLYLTVILISINLLLIIQDNRMVIMKSNYILFERRIFIEKALADGILKSVPLDQPIYFEDIYKFDPYRFSSDLDAWVNGYPWKNIAFVYKNTGLIYNIFTDLNAFNSVTTEEKFIVELSNCPSENKPGGACVKLLRKENTEINNIKPEKKERNSANKELAVFKYN